MRIIAGEFRRRQLETPPDAETTRPIPDRVKESIFQILRGHCEGASVYDGFAGTGAIGLEAVSRGAKHVVMVEKDRAVADILRRNVATLGVQDRCEVVQGDALGAGGLARVMRPLHLAFLDPPYPLVEDATGFRRVMAQMAALVAMLDDTGYAVLRTPWPLLLRQPEQEAPEATPHVRRKKKGNDRHAWKHELRRSEEGRGGKAHSARGTPRSGELDEDGDSVEWLDDEDVDEIVREGESGEQAADVEPAPGAPPAPPVAAVMEIPGAVGPETHVYRGMAVHLYMRKK